VVDLRRFGFHAQPTMLVLSFDTALDPARAQDPNNYQVFQPGRDRRIGTGDDVAVSVRSATYDATANTVTLAVAKRLSVFVQNRLVARGTGAGAIAGANGNLLDGDGNGQAGGDFTASFGREILAGSVINGSLVEGSTNGRPPRSPSGGGVTRSVSKLPSAVMVRGRRKALIPNGAWEVSDGGRYRHYILRLPS
jgi:hypothetical protein